MLPVPVHYLFPSLLIQIYLPAYHQLNIIGNITTSRQDFLAEWKQLLINVNNALIKCGYSIDFFEGGEMLTELINKIGESGVLYKLSVRNGSIMFD